MCVYVISCGPVQSMLLNNLQRKDCMGMGMTGIMETGITGFLREISVGMEASTVGIQWEWKKYLQKSHRYELWNARFENRPVLMFTI